MKKITYDIYSSILQYFVLADGCVESKSMALFFNFMEKWFT